MSKIDIDDLRDILSNIRLRIAEDDISPEQALDDVEREIDILEIETF